MWKIKVTAMAKTLNKIIQMHCHKGLSAAKIFRMLKGTVSHSGVYKAAKRCRVAVAYQRSVKTKELITKTKEKLRRNPQKSTKKLAQEAYVSCSIMQRVLVIDP